MKHKKLIVFLLIFTIAVAEFSWINFNKTTYAIDTNIPETEATEYYGKQLEKDPDAKMFYDVMVEMFKSGMFEKGEDYELTNTENGKSAKLNQSQLQAYATGSQHLLRMMAGARDAFQYDYPDAFWIDFSAITLRVTLSSDGRYHAYLGAGRRDDYLLPGFSVNEAKGKITIKEAVEKYEEKMSDALSKIQESAKAETDSETQNEKLARATHDYITKNMRYRYEYQVENYKSTEMPYSNARTAYDFLIYGEGVCESYTRAYKAILDRLGVPCVCVVGAYTVTNTQTEEHIWNYVQINNKWYGVDVTMDDPVALGRNSGRENRQYLLVGQTDLNAHHIPSKYFSSAEYEFTYPILDTATVDGEEFYDAGLFKVRAFGKDYLESDIDSSWEGKDSQKTTHVWVSYNGKNYTENAQDGKYIIARFAVYDSGLKAPSGLTSDKLQEWQENVEAKAEKKWVYTNWGYITPEMYGAELEKEKGSESYKHDKDLGDYLEFPLPNVELIQFSVTDIPPDTTVEGIMNGGLYYKGNPSLLTEKTPEIINKYDTVAKVPYIKKATPAQYSKLKFGETYHIRLEYDTELYQIDGEEMSVEIVDVIDPSRNSKPSVVQSSRIEHIEYDLANGVVEFDFIPSDVFAANEVTYEIEWKGVVGPEKHQVSGNVTPGRKPLKAMYTVGAPCDACAYHSLGIDWNTFGQPELMDGSTLDPKKFEGYEMGSNTLENFTDDVDLSALSHRLSLVTTTTSPEQNKEMLDKISEKTDDEVINSQTYNIRLQLCKMQVVKPGQSVRVRLGFPEGTTYEEYLSGEKEFKVYHYKYDAFGNITGVETIPVEVTRQGLILIVDSFSPFTIATVEGPGEDKAPIKKDLVLSSSDGGTVTCNMSDQEKQTQTINMTEKDTVEIVITADSDKSIESISIGTKVIPVTNKDQMTVTVNAEELEVGTTRMYVQFMSKAVEEKDTAKGETEVEQQQSDFILDENPDGDDVNYVSKIDTNMSVKDFVNKIDTIYTKVEVLDNNGTVVGEDKKVATGMKLKITHGDNTDTPEDDYDVVYDVVVHGDIDGTGTIDGNDIVPWRLNKVGLESLDGAYLKACDYDSSGDISSDDLVAMRMIYIENLTK